MTPAAMVLSVRNTRTLCDIYRSVFLSKHCAIDVCHDPSKLAYKKHDQLQQESKDLPANTSLITNPQDSQERFKNSHVCHFLHQGPFLVVFGKQELFSIVAVAGSSCSFQAVGIAQELEFQKLVDGTCHQSHVNKHRRSCTLLRAKVQSVLYTCILLLIIAYTF